MTEESSTVEKFTASLPTLVFEAVTEVAEQMRRPGMKANRSEAICVLIQEALAARAAKKAAPARKVKGPAKKNRG